MVRLLARALFVLGGIAGTVALPTLTAFGHGWDLAVDTPVQFKFDKSGPNQPAAGNPTAKWRDSTTTDVSGAKVMLTTPLHIGIGYEDYTVSQNFTAGALCSGACDGHAHMNIQMVDVLFHFPIDAFNLSLGYGQGQANFDAVAPPGAPNPNAAHHATAEQVFVVLGFHLGPSWDVHAGYHWVTIEKKDITAPNQTPPFDQLQGSGEMLSLGLQYSWGR